MRPAAPVRGGGQRLGWGGGCVTGIGTGIDFLINYLLIKGAPSPPPPKSGAFQPGGVTPPPSPPPPPSPDAATRRGGGGGVAFILGEKTFWGPPAPGCLAATPPPPPTGGVSAVFGGGGGARDLREGQREQIWPLGHSHQFTHPLSPVPAIGHPPHVPGVLQVCLAKGEGGERGGAGLPAGPPGCFWAQQWQKAPRQWRIPG